MQRSLTVLAAHNMKRRNGAHEGLCILSDGLFYHGNRVNLLSPWGVLALYEPSSEPQPNLFTRGTCARLFCPRALSSTSGKRAWSLQRAKTGGGYCCVFSATRASTGGIYFWRRASGQRTDTWIWTSMTTFEEIQADQLKGAPVEEGLFLPQRW